MTINPLARPDLATRNRFAPYATQVSPIDEAQVIPKLFQQVANGLPAGLCRTVLCRNGPKTIGSAHDYFAHFDHPGVATRQEELRTEMSNHLHFVALGDQVYDLDEPEPRNLLQRLALTFLDRVFPAHKVAREATAKDLRVERMVSKYSLCTTAVFKASFVQVAKATADEKQAA